MSIEYVIGFVSGIFGIISGIYLLIQLTKKFRSWLKKKKEKPLPPSMYELFNQLMKKENDFERKENLRRLNSYPLINNKIKEEYIQKFELGKRGGEEVLFDICDSNDIPPTDDICKQLLNYKRSKLMTRYQEKRQNTKAESVSEPIKLAMPDEPKQNTSRPLGEQIVYLSGKLKTDYSKTCNRLVQILEKHHVKYLFLEGTEDIWCRDYMPVQTKSGKLIQFKYDPSYLRTPKWEKKRSDVDKIRRLNGIEAQTSDITLDGGNILMCDGRAILSDRIYDENPDYKNRRDEQRKKLSQLLECEIIIIPSINKTDDFTGHADGMVRFVDRNTVLGIWFDDKYKKDWQKNMQRVLDTYNINFIKMPFFEDEPDPEYPDSAIGIYVNYLELNNLIVMPIFNRDEDNQAFDIIQKAFPNKIIEKIDYNDIAKEGGLLNCTTWVLQK